MKGGMAFSAKKSPARAIGRAEKVEVAVDGLAVLGEVPVHASSKFSRPLTKS